MEYIYNEGMKITLNPYPSTHYPLNHPRIVFPAGLLANSILGAVLSGQLFVTSTHMPVPQHELTMHNWLAPQSEFTLQAGRLQEVAPSRQIPPPPLMEPQAQPPFSLQGTKLPHWAPAQPGLVHMPLEQVPLGHLRCVNCVHEDEGGSRMDGIEEELEGETGGDLLLCRIHHSCQGHSGDRVEWSQWQLR